MSSRRLLVLLAVLAVVVLAGCAGGMSGAEAESPSTAATDEQTTTAPASTAEAVPDGELAVHVLNVGQGSSTLIIGPDGETILIDTGDWRDDGEEVIEI